MGLLHKLNIEWIWLKLSYSFRWSHHPTCDPYSDQRFDINIGSKTISFCQGCSLVTIGTIISFLSVSFLLINNVIINLVPLILIAVITVLFVSIVDGFSLNRFYKRIGRLMLGISSGTAIAGVIFYKNWILKIIILISLLLAIVTYIVFRGKTPPEDLCKTCEYIEDAPYCPGLVDQMEANKKYQQIVLPMMDQEIKSKLKTEITSNINRDTSDGGQNQMNENKNDNINVVWIDD